MPTQPPGPQTLRLNNFDSAQFLADYWQQAPLLVRGAVPTTISGVPVARLAAAQAAIRDGKASG